MLAGDPTKDRQRPFHQAAVGHVQYADKPEAPEGPKWACKCELGVHVCFWLGFGVEHGLNAQ
jgi:hypothetical protein